MEGIHEVGLLRVLSDVVGQRDDGVHRPGCLLHLGGLVCGGMVVEGHDRHVRPGLSEGLAELLDETGTGPDDKHLRPARGQWQHVVVAHQGDGPGRHPVDRLASALTTDVAEVLFLARTLGVLHPQHPLGFAVDVLFREPAGTHRRDDGGVRDARISRHQELVGTRFEGHDGKFGVTVALPQGGFGESVGDDDAAVAELLAQDPGDDGGAEGGRETRRVEGGGDDVSDEHRVHVAGVGELLERHGIDPVPVLTRVIEHR